MGTAEPTTELSPGRGYGREQVTSDKESSPIT